MKKIISKYLALLAVPLCAILPLSNSQAAADKPNIVLVFMDNFGYGELGCYAAR